MTERELLTSIEFFKGFDGAPLDTVLAATEALSFARGGVLFTENDPAAELFVVVSGRIAIANRSIDGRESVVALMERGDLLGEMPLFDGLPRSAEARALEPSEVLAIPYAPLRAIYVEQPELLWNVVEMLANRLRNTDEQLADSVFLDVTGRTAKRLLELAGEADEFSLPITSRLDRTVRASLPHHQSRTARTAGPLSQFVGNDSPTSPSESCHRRWAASGSVA